MQFSFKNGKLLLQSREENCKENIFIISFIMCTLEGTYIKINFIYYFNGCKYFRKANIYIRKDTTCVHDDDDEA